MIKTYQAHKRNTSQSLVAPDLHPHHKQQKKIKLQPSCGKNSKTLTLVQKSNNRSKTKQTIVENIEHLDRSEEDKQNSFFVFGQGNCGAKNNWQLNIDKIVEVQDSNSRRDFTSNRSIRETFPNYEKENQNTSNFESKSRKSTNAKSKKTPKRSKQPPCKKSRSNPNDKTKSSISLSRIRPAQNHSKQLEVRTARMEKSVKMLWECMGELWENSRMSQYRSQKNGLSITSLKKKLEEQEKQIIDMKIEISKGCRPGPDRQVIISSRSTGLRS